MTGVGTPVAAPARTRAATGGVARYLVAPATAIVILALSLLVLMTPMWMHLALDASGGANAQATPQLSHQLSDATVAELFVGPGTFARFSADEASHMRDVRLVLLVFLAVAIASAALVAWQFRQSRGGPGTWRSIARGGLALAVGVVVLGVFAALAFGVAFELFHRILFPGGNWAFTADSLLIRLYPYAFWQLSAAALGVLAIGGGILVWAFARRRARALA